MSGWEVIGGGLCCAVIGLVAGVILVHILFIRAFWDGWK